MPEANQPSPDPLLTTREAAQYLGLSRHTLNMWRSEGRPGPRYVRLGKAIRYRTSDLEAYIADSTTEVSA